MGRNPGQYVVIGDDIIVQIVQSPEGELRLATDTPCKTKCGCSPYKFIPNPIYVTGSQILVSILQVQGPYRQVEIHN